MKSILCRMALPLIAFSLVITSCSKTTDLSNKTSVTVNCVRNNTDPNALELGTELTLTRHESGDKYTNFTMVPSSIMFKNLKPGTYDLKGTNSNSNEILTIQVDANEEEVAQLSFDE